jgi:hypothetical protein
LRAPSSPFPTSPPEQPSSVGAENPDDVLDPITFSGDAGARPGPACPDARELQAMGQRGLDLGRQGRVTSMNQIGAALGVPIGGWHGQARLFKGNDLRLADLFPLMVRPAVARVIAANLERAARYVQVNLMLAMVSAQREANRSLTARGTALVETYHQGGLDFLESWKPKLGLPGSVTASWRSVGHYLNYETGHDVYPERIPARDQLLAYAAVMSASFSHNFSRSVRVEFGSDASVAIGRASRLALIVWQAYAFLAPGGVRYTPACPLRDQLGQRFGHRSALGFYAHRARAAGRPPSLDDILSDHSLDHLEWLRSAKTRSAEAVFMERLWRSVG